MKTFILISFIFILSTNLIIATSVHPTPFTPSKEKTVTTLPGNSIKVAYVDRLSSYWGAANVAAAIGLPGYAKSTLYNVINLAFILENGEADAASVWANPFGFME